MLTWLLLPLLHDLFSEGVTMGFASGWAYPSRTAPSGLPVPKYPCFLFLFCSLRWTVTIIETNQPTTPPWRYRGSICNYSFHFPITAWPNFYCCQHSHPPHFFIILSHLILHSHLEGK
ncbi:hypothetical protein BGZ63DRAFT_94216 [Mariannaea sp. PMI_226]|nr:hypothetical protein BGZ63DRAFT_94216 [Mariannaea sp. PMI_226]